MGLIAVFSNVSLNQTKRRTMVSLKAQLQPSPGPNGHWKLGAEGVHAEVIFYWVGFTDS